MSTPSEHRAGFIAVVGRPNTGKSTLVNALVGKKVVITSHHPNTTRNPIRGIISQENFQMILVDTPGVHKPKTLLGNRLNAMVAESIESVDGALLCLPVNEKIGAGDEYVLDSLSKIRRIYIAITKVDLAKPEALMEKLLEVQNLLASKNIVAEEIVPVSGKNMDHIDLLLDLLSKHLPPSPALYPDDISTDQATELMICEWIREAAIADLYEELPHSVMVTLEEFDKREDKELFDIHATIHVERDSQKGIIIGPRGVRLKEIGSKARAGIETFLGAKVFLGLHVKVSKEWQRDPKALARMGFTE